MAFLLLEPQSGFQLSRQPGRMEPLTGEKHVAG